MVEPETGVRTSRRLFLGAMLASPFAALAITETASTGAEPSFSAHELTFLRRTPEGRSLSRNRYHKAESFFDSAKQGLLTLQSDQLYFVGITLQLGLSSHLLDVGFDDAWCARNIGLHVAKSLAYANATALGHECPDLKRLAEILSPYSKWRNADESRALADCSFSHQQFCQLTRELLDRVRIVTGHPRPRRRHRS